MTEVEYLILGGGVAGLCAAKRLLELGIAPLVIEGGSYPSHKVCGEFISSSSLPILKQWNIIPVQISSLQWHAGSKTMNFPFQQPAGSLSHLTLDQELAHQISREGASLLTNTKVIECIPSSKENDFHLLTLSSGEKIKAYHLLVATGRHPSSPSQKWSPRYVGFKAHFSEIEFQETLHMFSFPGAYLGLSPVENGSVNVACLASMEIFSLFASAEAFMQHLVTSQPMLEKFFDSGKNLCSGWMQTFIPPFGLRSPPVWPRTYWIGDAASTIPPASGNGLSMAISSGCLAAEYAAKNQPQGFRKEWAMRSLWTIRWAKGLHHLFLNPSLAKGAISLGNAFPFFAQQIFNATRHD